MGIASLVLGIVAILICWIPIIGVISFVLTIVGLILGIIEITRKDKTQEQKGIGIAGVIICAIAIPIIIITTIISIGVLTASIIESDDWIDQAQDTLNELVYEEEVNANRLHKQYHHWDNEEWL